MPNFLWINTKKGERIKLDYTESQRRIVDIRMDYLKRQEPCWLLVLKGRQRGVSTVGEGFMFTETYCGENCNTLVMAHLKQVTSELLEKARLFYDCLPEELQMPFQKSNELDLAWKHNRSKMSLATAGTIDIAHGRTLRKVHLSEISRYPDLYGLLKGLQQAVAKSPDSFVLAESTAKGSDDAMYDLWDEAVKKKNRWQPLFLKWMDDSDAKRVFNSDIERESFLQDVFDRYPNLKDRMEHYFPRKQWGNSIEPAERMAWYADRLIGDCLGDENYVKQEYPMSPAEAFLASGTPYFPSDCTELYANKVRPGALFDPRICFTSRHRLQPAPHLNRDKEPYLEVWQPPRRGRKYLISADSAEGIPGRDPCSAMVFDIASMNLVAEIHGVIEPHPFENMITQLGYLYNNAVIAPEAHGAGAALCAILKNNGYQPMYYKRVLRNNVWMVTGDLGFDTNASSKPQMLSEGIQIYRARKGDGDFIPSEALINEMRFFVVKSFTGQGGAANGKHDDRVMAWLIGIMCCLQYLGMADTGISSVRGTGTMRSTEPSPSDLLEMVKSSNWCGQSYGEFYKSSDFITEGFLNYDD
ncbi:MAG TPA: hypothetical protein V6C86_24175 [Oculatellaceae cyanobacterium]